MQLNDYVEKDIIRKKDICELLYNGRIRKRKWIANKLEVSEGTILQDIKKMNNLFQPINVNIHATAKGYHLDNPSFVSKKGLTAVLLEKSLFLKALTFFCQNQEKTLADFANQYFISLSQAYKLRGRVQAYLREIGLELNIDRITGLEYRLRFFKAYIQIMTGVQLIKIPKRVEEQIQRFIHETSVQIQLDFAPQTIEYLVLLIYLGLFSEQEESGIPQRELEYSPKRLSYAVSANLDLLSSLAKKERLKKEEPYFTLIFCVQNEKHLDIDQTYSSLEYHDQHDFRDNRQVQDLFGQLESRFHKEFLLDDPILWCAFNNFFKKTICDLQPLIPQERVFLPTAKQEYYYEIRQMLFAWKKKWAFPYQFDDMHIQQLALHTFESLHERSCYYVNLVTESSIDFFSYQILFDKEFRGKIRIHCQVFSNVQQALQDAKQSGNSVLCDEKIYLPTYKKLFPQVSPVSLAFTSREWLTIEARISKKQVSRTPATKKTE
ncbi:helix-turn-helix domain-containing protein [Listeria costaricensis]|uniref:helix-turn-helix domain-containing protein n=1 Tax=Listeria costaricensis TaxID=2026604 RepID=UPI000C07CB4A|nr:helix-turn-helix domain-containing protein [Listeria costaricensis]